MKNELMRLLRDTKAEYDRCAEASRLEVMQKLPPYAQTPATGRLHTDGAKARVAAYADRAREKACEIIDREIAAAQQALAVAPSTEAINLLTTLSITKTRDVRDYEAIYSAYGSNPQVAKALTALARENGASFAADVPEYDRVETLKDFRSSFDKSLNPISVTDGKLSAGAIAFLEMSMDGSGID